MVKDIRGGIRPVILKFGFILVVSIGGIIYTITRTKRRINPNSNLFLPSSSTVTGCENGKLAVDDQASPSHSSRKSVSTVSEKHEDSHIPKHIIENSTADPSSNGFDEVVKELSLSTSNGVNGTYEDSPREYEIVEMVNYELEEINILKNTVETLQARERNLEIQLLEFYGLKEQETAILELRNQLKVNDMEAKLFGLKIESLAADKMRLEGQVANYANVVSDLEAAKAKIKQLKRRLKSEASHSKEQILNLQGEVMKLHDDEEKKAVEAETDVQLMLRKLKDLENQADELKKSNHSLEAENSELAQRLESVQILATSVLEDEETEALKEETQQLRKQNEDLVKEVERLKADRCNDAEELVYLRWINACLRHEMRNYQPVSGKTMARDLSKTLSPKSEEKAKQLILEYANNESQGEKDPSAIDFDSDWSSSRTSIFTDSSELDDISTDNPSLPKIPRKKKVFGKLMRLMRGKNNQLRKSSSMDNVAKHSSYSSGYSDSSSQGSRRSEKGENDSCLNDSRRSSDGGSSSSSGRLDYISNCLSDTPQENGNKDEPEETVQKTDLEKYAEVLKESRPKTGFCRRSASLNSF